jgi:hypothetical protein
MTILTFPEYAPDRAAFRGGGQTITNVFPTADGYRPVKNLSVITDALSGQCLGSLTVRDSSNNVYIYAGTSTSLEECVSNSWTDESQSAYTTTAGDVWEFAAFGDNVIAINGSEEAQYIAIGGGGAGAFADLVTSTDTPTAKHIATIGDFLFLGHVTDEAGTTPNRIRWSAINDPTDFDESTSTQSDKQDLPDGGWVQAIAGNNEYGLVFQDTKIRRVTYVGPPAIFQIETVINGTGTPVPNSVIQHDRQTFFISEHGFMRVLDGSQVEDIGIERVNRTLWNELDPTNRAQVSASVDPRNNVVMWAIPGSGSSGTANKIYMYHWRLDRWAIIDPSAGIEWLSSGATQGMNVDSGIITDIDNDGTYSSLSIDDDIFKGGQLRIGAFKTDHRLYHFIGDDLAATIDTTEDQPTPMGLSRALSARTLADGGTWTITPIYRDLLTDSVTTGSAISANSFGEYPMDVSARFIRFRATCAAGGTWTHAQGIEITRMAAQGFRAA